MTSKTNLPIPWEVRFSKTQSKYYYYNRETKISQWKKPLSDSSKEVNQRKLTEVIECGKRSSAKTEVSFTQKKNENDERILSSQTKHREADATDTSGTAKKFKLSDNGSTAERHLFIPRAVQKSTTPLPVTGLDVADKAASCTRSVAAAKLTASNSGSGDGKLQVMLNVSLDTKKMSKKSKKRKSKTVRMENSGSAGFSFVADAACAGANNASFESAFDTVKSEYQNSDASVHPLRGELPRVEEEEDMDVEFSPEVQMICQELHGFREEMQRSDISQEMTTEVQTMVDNLTSASTSLAVSSDQKFWLVIDTNVFLGDKEYLLNLKETTLKNCPNFMFVIPWIVLQEIDRIKDHNRSLYTPNSVKMKFRAQSIVTTINGWLERKDSSVVGQNPQEAASLYETINGFLIENNDDKILHCCLQYQKKYSKEKVVLLTLDKNLRNKAMVMGINAFSKETMGNWLKGMLATQKSSFKQETSQNSSVQLSPLSSSVRPEVGLASLRPNPSFSPNKLPDNGSFGFGPSHQVLPVTSGYVTDTNSAPNSYSCQPMEVATSQGNATWKFSDLQGTGDNLQREDEVFSKAFNGSSNCSPLSRTTVSQSGVHSSSKAEQLCEISSSLESIMLKCLSSFVEISMKEAYKDLWEAILEKKKPWSLRDVLKSIDKHWIAVFRDFWSQSDQCVLKELTAAFWTGSVFTSDIESRILKCRQLWIAFDTNRFSRQSLFVEEYHQIKREAMLRLNKLRDSLAALKNNTTDLNANLAQHSETLQHHLRPSQMGDASDSFYIPSCSLPSSAAAATAAASASIVSHSVPSDNELQRVCDCFDVVLKRIILLRDNLCKALVNSLNQPHRQPVVESYSRLCAFMCVLCSQYQRAVLLNKDSSECEVYHLLVSTLLLFCQQENVPVPPITSQTMKSFFSDITQQKMVQIGFTQIQSIQASIHDLRQLLSPAEASCWSPVTM